MTFDHSRRVFVNKGAKLGLIASTGLAAYSLFGRTALAMERKFSVMKTPDEWRKVLTPEQFAVLRNHATERPFSSPLNAEKREGVYKCAGCETEVFSSHTKFESGTGWPSFYDPIEGGIGTQTDWKLLYPRTEVHCATCGGHLGHVFKDGPAPTGLRYCMNGVAMTFKPTKE
jgi:peptide-methionine (R)-S-oxide reductase